MLMRSRRSDAPDLLQQLAAPRRLHQIQDAVAQHHIDAAIGQQGLTIEILSQLIDLSTPERDIAVTDLARH